MVKNAKGRLAVPIAAALALLLTPLTASAAGAAGGSPVIDPGAKGSVTIVKLGSRAQIPDGAQANGAPIDNLSTDPDKVYRIGGVQFAIQRLEGFDLTTPAGWDGAQALTAAAAADPNSLKNLPSTDLQTGCTGWASTTGAAAGQIAHHCKGVGLNLPDPASQPDGTLTFSGLSVGVYVVSEQETPANVIPAVPFLVTIPMTNPDKPAEWMYDVTVYPKNAITGVTKTVADDDLLLGRSIADADDTDVTYEVTMPVPEATSKLIITDILDERLGFTLNPNTFRVLGRESEQWQAEDKGAYSEATIGSDVLIQYGTLDGVARTLRVEFTGPDAGSGPGLIADETVGFSFDAAVDVAKMVDDPVISNTARYEVTVAGGTATGTSTVETKWGGISVLKTASGAVPLPGASFNVATSEENAKNGVFLYEHDTVSGPDGRLTFEGLRYSAWADGQSVDGDDIQTYYLVETKAPAGYERVSDPTPFTVSSTAVDAALITVENKHQPGFELPTIGGNRAVLPLLAVLVVGGGIAWLVRSRRVND